MKAAMIVHFHRAFPGFEVKAVEYGMEVNEYWGKLAAEGKCTTPEMFFETTGYGQWMVKGDLETLEALAREPKAQELITKGGLLLQDFGYDFALTGEAADEYLVQYVTFAKGFTTEPTLV